MAIRMGRDRSLANRVAAIDRAHQRSDHSTVHANAGRRTVTKSIARGDACRLRIGTHKAAICAPRGTLFEPWQTVVRPARRGGPNVRYFATRCGSRLFAGINLATPHVPVQYRSVISISTLHVTLALSHSMLRRTYARQTPFDERGHRRGVSRKI